MLGLRLIDASHNADNIVERVSNVLNDYGILNKVFSVTLDNASANNKAMDKLKPVLKEYLGSDLFLHQRCACHIINLIVKEALVAVSHMLDLSELLYYSLTLLTRELLHIRVIAWHLVLDLGSLD